MALFWRKSIFLRRLAKRMKIIFRCRPYFQDIQVYYLALKCCLEIQIRLTVSAAMTRENCLTFFGPPCIVRIELYDPELYCTPKFM